ncbi:MAG: hypothetical protein IT427_11855 [Pirellulales bacterium]|nr:hypothetical protein [Pirellulales bacterium]
MLSFHVTVRARPERIAMGPPIELRNKSIRTLAISPALLTTPFRLSFEEVAAQLDQLERMLVEPDGSFVWVSSQAGSHWQVDGNLFDRDGRLLFVDLKGHCPAEQFDRLLATFDWPTTALIFELTREAAMLDEVEFRRFAEVSACAE